MKHNLVVIFMRYIFDIVVVQRMLDCVNVGKMCCEYDRDVSDEFRSKCLVIPHVYNV